MYYLSDHIDFKSLHLFVVISVVASTQPPSSPTTPVPTTEPKVTTEPSTTNTQPMATKGTYVYVLTGVGLTPVLM